VRMCVFGNLAAGIHSEKSATSLMQHLWKVDWGKVKTVVLCANMDGEFVIIIATCKIWQPNMFQEQ
jgi:hypothetical protein